MQINQEDISGAMDGEAVVSAELAEIARDETARATWARYHLIGDVLRDNVTGVAPPSFAAQLVDKIGQEPTVLAPPRNKSTSVRPVIGFAVAASVAALAVIGVQQFQTGPEVDAAPAVVSVVNPPAATPVVAVAEEPAAGTAFAEMPQEPPLRAQRRLNGYLVKFNEQRSSVGVPSVNPYVRIVGFEPQ